jgi:hypothetical protein
MDREKFEQCCAIKFCVKLGESATETYENLQRAYREHSLSRAQVFRWHKSSLEGLEQVEDKHHAGRTSTSKTDNIVERVRSGGRPQGICATRTNSQTFYREVLERLRKRVARVRPGIARTWMLHHDYTPCHKANPINESLAEKKIPVVPQPPLFSGSQSL